MVAKGCYKYGWPWVEADDEAVGALPMVEAVPWDEAYDEAVHWVEAVEADDEYPDVETAEALQVRAKAAPLVKAQPPKKTIHKHKKAHHSPPFWGLLD